MFKVPKTRTDFWMGKIRGNKARDLKTESLLVEQGWRVFRIWECALKGPERIDSDVLLLQFTTWLTSSEQLGSIPAEGSQSLI
ncbi:T/G mismatch-specific endonuclease [Luteibacter sp. 22Crub2.1]|nr:T/G mismatch-specific endonuclease [Luteibacter sp. 22Crub2.1]